MQASCDIITFSQKTFRKEHLPAGVPRQILARENLSGFPDDFDFGGQAPLIQPVFQHDQILM